MNITRATDQSYSQEQERAVVSTEISKIGASAITILLSVIACWATACLFAGTLRVGGPLSLLANLVNAIIG